ncbi:DUF5018 domain-containing protein [Dawidia soli]|uniref:DUF5018 domain-containing protein n=1 Tax=Dawidia soli TaxID=2782352 RepID=A0AAP2D757_9BACT|nr:DUF5018 domain-containing protein [Dawidia soli]MBT1686626.1 DUF5018 domain-containing protein [Dawidia soli]
MAASCSDDDSDPTVVKSSAKAITSFKFAAPAATGTITESDKKIAVSVPAGTNVTELVPTIVVSEKATVSPNTGEKQNFTNAVTYTVTAEDGSKQAYVVTVTVAAAEKFTVSGISATEIEGGEEFFLEGTNFAAASASEIKLTNIDSKEFVTIKAADKSTATRLYFTAAEDLEVGEYAIVVTSSGKSEEVEFTLTILPKLPKITGLSALKVENGDHITITGKNFSAEGNTVSMWDENGFGSSKEIVSESTTSIEFIVEAISGRRYHVEVKNANGDVVEAADMVVVGTLPEVTSINKTTFARGEQIVLTGQGLKVDGISPFLYFMPDAIENDFRQGIGKVNDAGTEITYTIPTGWAADSYELSIDFDDTTIKKFRIVIQ